MQLRFELQQRWLLGPDESHGANPHGVGGDSPADHRASLLARHVSAVRRYWQHGSSNACRMPHARVRHGSERHHVCDGQQGKSVARVPASGRDVLFSQENNNAI